MRCGTRLPLRAADYLHLQHSETCARQSRHWPVTWLRFLSLTQSSETRQRRTGGYQYTKFAGQCGCGVSKPGCLQDGDGTGSRTGRPAGSGAATSSTAVCRKGSSASAVGRPRSRAVRGISAKAPGLQASVLSGSAVGFPAQVQCSGRRDGLPDRVARGFRGCRRQHQQFASPVGSAVSSGVSSTGLASS